MSAAHTHLTFSAPTPLQAGIAAALDADDGLESIGPLFSENFELLAAALRAGTNVRAASVILVRVAPFILRTLGALCTNALSWPHAGTKHLRRTRRLLPRGRN
eukprot:COSAG01_NODE_650_length_14506_cov_24.157354_19_plen_103_part_00